MSNTIVRDHFEIGERASFSKTISEEDVRAFASLTHDFNPLHLDAEYASRTRFGRPIAHGILTAGLISTVLGTRLPGTGAIYLNQTLKFLAPVYHGDTITATVQVTAWRPDKRIVTLQTECHNQEGTCVLSGEAVMMMAQSA
jgi:3-hydroxybutyryl-CoA dehydratase